MDLKKIRNDFDGRDIESCRATVDKLIELVEQQKSELDGAMSVHKSHLARIEELSARPVPAQTGMLTQNQRNALSHTIGFMTGAGVGDVAGLRSILAAAPAPATLIDAIRNIPAVGYVGINKVIKVMDVFGVLADAGNSQGQAAQPEQQPVAKLIAEIRAAKTMAFRDSLFEKLIEALEAAPVPAAAPEPLQGWRTPQVEALAKEIYAAYPGADAHPWVDDGNSHKQEDARREACRRLAATPSPSGSAA